MATLSEILNLPIGTVLNYTKYDINRLGQKTAVQSLRGHILERIILPNEALGIEELHNYYGTELSYQDYMQLSSVGTYRLVLYITDDQENRWTTVVNIDRYFLEVGQIEVDYSTEAVHLNNDNIFGLYGTKVKFDD